MVMFFPMVKLAIHGYEVLILSLASPIILYFSLINNIAEVCLIFSSMKLGFSSRLEYIWKIIHAISGGC